MKCVVCNEDLGKWKIKYCTKTCYDWLKSEQQKERYKNRSPKLPKIPCILCAKPFQPRDKRHICCDVACRRLLENRKDRDYRKENPKPKQKPATLYFCTSVREEELRDKPKEKEKSKPKKNTKKSEEKKAKKKGKVVIRPLPIANSEYSGQIKEFEKDGGRIQVFAPQCNGRTPDVNITSISGWSVETMYGYGYEIQLMEELNDVS